MRHYYLAVFMTVLPLTSVVYWWRADWWAYVYLSSGPQPKFMMPWWWQIGESCVVGSVAATLVVGAFFLLFKLRNMARHKKQV